MLTCRSDPHDVQGSGVIFGGTGIFLGYVFQQVGDGLKTTGDDFTDRLMYQLTTGSLRDSSVQVSKLILKFMSFATQNAEMLSFMNLMQLYTQIFTDVAKGVKQIFWMLNLLF